jgi:hypothetical protein
MQGYLYFLSRVRLQIAIAHHLTYLQAITSWGFIQLQAELLPRVRDDTGELKFEAIRNQVLKTIFIQIICSIPSLLREIEYHESGRSENTTRLQLSKRSVTFHIQYLIHTWHLPFTVIAF